MDRGAGEQGPPEQVLEDSASRLRAVIETAVDGVIIIDVQGIVELFNPACQKIFGYGPGEVVGQNVKMLMPTPYHENHDEYLHHYVATGERRIIGIGREVLGRRKDGSVFPLELSVGEVRQGSDTAFVGIIRDVSERHRTQQRIAEMHAELVHVARVSAMGEMASALAHELNQPLTAVMNYASALRRMIEQRDRFPPERIVDTIDKTVEQASRAGQIIRRLRELIRRGGTDREAADVNHVIREASALALVGVREQNIAASFELAADLPPVLIDQVQIQQVILNLVRNSVEALLGSGQRHITIASRPAGAMVEVCISDTGSGLAKEVLSRLFHPFVTTKESGMGIGLSISRSIIEAHGGQISAWNNQGGGATFRFTLPAVGDGDAPA